MELKLNVYDGGKTVKTYTASTVNIEYGLVEDLLGIIDLETLDLDDISNKDLGMLIIRVLPLIKPFLCNVFEGLTEEEVRHVSLLELKDVFVEIYRYIESLIGGLGTSDSKN